MVAALSPLPAGHTFTIVNNTGSGPLNTFFSKAEGFPTTSNGQQFFISYHGGDGNDVTLHVTETRTWSGNGTTDSWSEGANWVGGVAPVPGDDLIFPASALRKTTNNNDLASGTTFNSISFTGSGYNLNGNGIRLMNGIVDSVGGNPTNEILLGSILLRFDQTFSELGGPIGLLIQSNLDTNGRTLTLDGPGDKKFFGIISGSGSLIVNGGSVATRQGAGSHTVSGPTIINSGVLYPGIQPNSAIQLNGGFLVVFGSTAKSVTAFGGVIYQLNSAPTTISGNLDLSSNVTYQPQFGISSVGRLEVGGAVNLADSSLNVEALFTTPPPGNSFTIINKTSAGPIPGTFKDLPEGATLLIKGFPFRISYIGGDGNDVVLTKAPPVLLNEEGANSRAAVLDSVTFVRGPFKILTDHNFSADHHTRLVLFTSNLELTQPDPSLLTVQAGAFILEVEKVGTLTKAANGIDCSYIVVRLRDSLTPGNYQLSFTLRGVTSNAGVLSISP